MASLVADYSDSSDSEDESIHADDVDKKRFEVNVKVEIKEEELSESAAPSTPSLNFFETSGDVSDDDEDDISKSTTSIKVKGEKTSSTLSRLPSLAEVNPGIIGSSVFVNPFDRAEQAKNQILEKHVKLTEAAPQKPASQPVCWKFKKGKCHMGKNCRFFHAVDKLSSTDECVTTNDRNNSMGGMSSDSRSPYHPAAFAGGHRRPLEVEAEDEDNYMNNMKKKKRVGINDRLVPPKKAFDALLEIRKKERPWTMPGAPS